MKCLCTAYLFIGTVIQLTNAAPPFDIASFFDELWELNSRMGNAILRAKNQYIEQKDNQLNESFVDRSLQNGSTIQLKENGYERPTTDDKSVSFSGCMPTTSNDNEKNATDESEQFNRFSRDGHIHESSHSEDDEVINENVKSDEVTTGKSLDNSESNTKPQNIDSGNSESSTEPSSTKPSSTELSNSDSGNIEAINHIDNDEQNRDQETTNVEVEEDHNRGWFDTAIDKIVKFFG